MFRCETFSSTIVTDSMLRSEANCNAPRKENAHHVKESSAGSQGMEVTMLSTDNI